MGYTHYWYKKPELPQDKWDAFAKDVKNFTEEGFCSGILCFEYDSPTVEPKVGKNFVRFNGVNINGGETFFFDRKQVKGVWSQMDEDGLYFNSCKTNRRAYDKYVVEVLKLARQHFGDDIKLSSDGGEQVFQNTELKNDLNK